LEDYRKKFDFKGVRTSIERETSRKTNKIMNGHMRLKKLVTWGRGGGLEETNQYRVWKDREAWLLEE
jgi:hypothetical protein